MPYVKRTAAGRISAVFDRPSREAKERVRANDPELLRFLGLAPTQSVDQTVPVDPTPIFEDNAPLFEAPYEETTAPPPAYDHAVYDESQDYISAETEQPGEAVPPAPLPEPPPTPAEPVEEVPLETSFSLPDDMPEDEEEDNGFAEDFELETTPESTAPAAIEAEETVEPDAPVFEDTDIPSGIEAPEPPAAAPEPSQTSPQKAAANPPQASPPPPPAQETPDGEDNKSSENIDGSALEQLDASDLEMARITEDLIDLLIGRNIINFTDFPGMAQRKLINRRALRSNMSALTNLVGDEENIF